MWRCEQRGGCFGPGGGGGELACPKHSWKLDLNTLTYQNGSTKTPIDPTTYTHKNNTLTLYKPSNLHNPFKPTTRGNFSLRYHNHACVSLYGGGLHILTDPWLLGSAFLTGWWHAHPSSEQALQALQEADLIYISHNHPDHLSPQTLELVSKDTLIICANFDSKSTQKGLQNLGFKNVIPLDFKQIYQVSESAQLALLKSGDFRDDSGLYLCLEGHEIILSVDSNFLNQYILPQNLSLLCSAFAGGASGFPLCFENYSHAEQESILKRNLKGTFKGVEDLMQVCRPKAYMPYAGMFKERAQRDKMIAQRNHKHCPKDYENLCNAVQARYLEPRPDTLYSFTSNGTNQQEVPTTLLNLPEPEVEIQKLKETYHYDPIKLIAYLKEANYHDRQIVYFVPTNDDFSQELGAKVVADFSTQSFRTLEPEETMLEAKEGFKIMVLKMRAEILALVVARKLPFEDFSIGFHCRVWRNPNVYESAFWFHFTNVCCEGLGALAN
ncbi:MBL fold metallo-hydrolase [Helicobacter felis]|uniref:MBL fold metallo-hydrolase n=1 Tax=Helicobacter felis TaxID=214 RepID=UPI000CF13DEA|nr:MBL fold metallo-hydrolase [Helicobacter felis]